MATVTFDTLKFVETLKAAGVPEEQAKAISAAVRDVYDAADLATKRDLKDLELVLRSELRELELRLTLKLGAMTAASIGIVAALVKLL
jgi:hypothetical protein